MKIIIMIVMLFFCGGGLFYVKQLVHVAEDSLSIINRDIATSNEAIQVLKTEWSFLNRPERLENLTEVFLEMEAPSGKQIASKDLMPFLPKTAKDKELEKIYTSVAYIDVE